MEKKKTIIPPEEIINFDSVEDNNIVLMAEDLVIDPLDCNPIEINLGYDCKLSNNNGGSEPTPTSIHNQLEGLQGGSALERYHVDKNISDALSSSTSPSFANPFATLSDIPTSTEVPHNELEGLQGGTTAERYHLDLDTYNGIIISGVSPDNRVATLGDINDSNYLHTSGSETKTGDLTLVGELDISDASDPNNKVRLFGGFVMSVNIPTLDVTTMDPSGLWGRQSNKDKVIKWGDFSAISSGGTSTYNLPNKPTGVYTLATTDDITGGGGTTERSMFKYLPTVNEPPYGGAEPEEFIRITDTHLDGLSTLQTSFYDNTFASRNMIVFPEPSALHEGKQIVVTSDIAGNNIRRMSGGDLMYFEAGSWSATYMCFYFDYSDSYDWSLISYFQFPSLG